MSIGNDPAVQRREHARAGVRRGLPAWALHRPGPAASEDARAVAGLLAALAPYGWSALHGVHRPGRPLAGIDHVVVGPGGVVVVQLQAAHGRTEDVGTALRRDSHPLTRRVAAAAGSASAVTALLAPRHRTAVRAVVCLPDRSCAPRDAAGGATVVGRDELVAHLRALPPRLSPLDASGLAQFLGLRLGGEQCPDLLTTAAVAADVRAARRRVVGPRTSDVSAQAPATVHRAPGVRAWVLRAFVVTAAVWLGMVAVAGPLTSGG